MLGLIPEERQDCKYGKRLSDSKDIYTINKHFNYQRESRMAENENPTPSDGIKVDVPPNKEVTVRKHSPEA